MATGYRTAQLLGGLLFIMSAILTGCEGSGEGLNESGRPLGDGSADGELHPTIDSIQVHVFDAHCVRCHAGANAPAGMRLDDAQTSHDNLVGVQSTEDPRFLRVEAGNADDSYLIHKVEGTQTVGDQMPPDDEPLDQQTIDVIRRWIDEGAAPPSGNGGGGGGSNGGGGFEPTIEAIQLNVFDPNCVSCHSGPVPAGPGLNLQDAETSHMFLVGVPSVQEPTLFRVEEGDADNSYLIHKLEGTNSFGDQMPAGGDPLPQATINVIRQWIDNGAPPPESQSQSTARSVSAAVPPQLKASWPQDNGWLPANADYLLVGFDRSLDSASLVSGTIRLLQLDAGTGPQDVAFTWTLANPRTLLIFTSLGPGDYRVEVSGSGSDALTGDNGIAIDGNGDGQPGGDLIVEFFKETEP